MLVSTRPRGRSLQKREVMRSTRRISISPEAQLELAEYNERCKGDTLGIGRIDVLTGLWRPLLPTGERYG